MSKFSPFDPRYVRTGFDNERLYTIGDLSFTEFPCYYCGDPGVTDDHAFPVAATHTLADMPELFHRRMMRIVPCCQECNGLLGPMVFKDMLSRKAYLKKRLRKRYKTLLDMPEWTDSEISQLSGRIRQYVLNSLAHRERLLARLKW